jgi:hypothetical protein
MNENEKLLLDLSVKSAAQGIKAAVNTLETVGYLLARAQGDLVIRKKMDSDLGVPRLPKTSGDGYGDYLFMDNASSLVAEKLTAIRKLQEELLTIRNNLAK